MKTTTQKPLLSLLKNWTDFNYEIKTQKHKSALLTENQIKAAVNSFKNEITTFLESLPANKELVNYKNFKLLTIFKIKTTNNQIRSLTHMQTINIDEINNLEQLFIES